MADFTITIGSVTSAAKNINVAKALIIIDSYLAAHGLDNTGTNQEKADLYAISIVKYTLNRAHGQQRLESQRADLIDFEANKEGME